MEKLREYDGEVLENQLDCLRTQTAKLLAGEAYENKLKRDSNLDNGEIGQIEGYRKGLASSSRKFRAVILSD
jgi:hypothetical protein